MRDLERGLRAVEQPQELVAAELAVAAQDEERRPVSCRTRRGTGSARCASSGPTGSSVFGRAPPANWSFGPWPRKCVAIGAPTKATRKRKMMKMPAADRDLVALEPAPDLLPVAAGAYLLNFAELGAALCDDRRSEAGSGGDDVFAGIGSRRHGRSDLTTARRRCL